MSRISAANSPRSPSLKTPPNVLLFFTDQQRWDTVGAYGNPMGLTLNLDRMAARGVRFERAFTCQPVCAPARACLQTGRFATEHGVWRNAILLDPAAETIGHHFRRQGYWTAYIGKWHLANLITRPVPKEYRTGYEYWLASDTLEYTSHPYRVTMFDGDGQPVHLPGYRVDALTDAAIRYLEAHGSDGKPFFLTVSYIEPHQQNDMNKLCAPDGYAARYRDPLYVPWDLVGAGGDWRKELPDYYGMVARLDENLGRILAALDRLDLARRTVVFFLTDHGCHFRTRNREYKRSPHESSIRIPLVAQGPGFDRGAVVPELVSLIDLPPTLLEIAGAPIPAAMRGTSLLSLFDRRKANWQDDVFVQTSEEEVGRAVRTEHWKYSVHAPEKNGGKDSSSERYVEQYLYDLEHDPWERENLIGRPEHRAVADEMRERLIRRMVGAGEREPEIVRAR